MQEFCSISTQWHCVVSFQPYFIFRPLIKKKVEVERNDFGYLLSNGFRSNPLNRPMTLSSNPSSPVFSCNNFTPSWAVCWAFLSSFIPASFFTRCTTSSLLTFCCVLVNCCLSLSVNKLVMLD